MDSKDNRHEVKLTIQSTRGTKTLTFPMTAKIAEVIEAARKAFDLSPGDRYELASASSPGELLQHERTLVSYHITDGDILILTWTGSGV